MDNTSVSVLCRLPAYSVVYLMHIIVIQGGKTALISAAWLGQVQTVVLLLQAGADVNMYDEVRLCT